MRHWDVIFLFIFGIVIKGVITRQSLGRYAENSHLSKFYDRSYETQRTKPLVLFIKYNKGANIGRGGFDTFSIPNGDGILNGSPSQFQHDEEEAQEQAKYLLYTYLHMKSSARSPDPKPSLLKVLRSRCDARVQCEEKCEKRAEKKAKEYCVPNCKVVFDNLNMCKQPKPKNDPCKPKSDCGSQNWGSTKGPPPSDEISGCESDGCGTKEDSCGLDDTCGVKEDSCEDNDSCGVSDNSCESSNGC